MAAVKLTGLDEVKTLIRDMPKHLFDKTKIAIGGAILRVHADVSNNFVGFSGTSGEKLQSRTGLLRRSLTTRVKGSNLKDLSGSLFTNVIYAPIQETGGKIKAIDKYLGVPGGPYLNIPLLANKTAAGVTRENAKAVFDGGGYIIKSRVGNYIVMSGTNTPMFVLVKSVTIPPRLGMEEALIDEVPTLLSTLKNILLDDL